MDINETIKKTLKQNQEIIEASYKALVITHGYTEQITVSALEQVQAPSDSIKMLKNTFNECCKTRDTIKKCVDDGYSNLQDFFK